MSANQRKRGNELTPTEQTHVLRSFVHRHTGEHRPQWARGIWKDGKPYPVQFADDAEWLAHTTFAVTKSGRLDRRVNSCESSPTWPYNPELRVENPLITAAIKTISAHG